MAMFFYVLSTLFGYLKPKHVIDGKNNLFAGEYPINIFFRYIYIVYCLTHS